LLQEISRQGALVVMTTHNLQLLHDYPGRVFRCEEHKLTELAGGEEL
jgi:cell division transport system ATP-binding protein